MLRSQLPHIARPITLAAKVGVSRRTLSSTMSQLRIGERLSNDLVRQWLTLDSEPRPLVW